MTAEELFNMFFGGSGFASHPSNIYMRRNGRWHRTNDDDNSSQVRHICELLFTYIVAFMFVILFVLIDASEQWSCCVCAIFTDIITYSTIHVKQFVHIRCSL